MSLFWDLKIHYDKTFLFKLAQAEILLHSQRKLGCQTYGFPLASRMTEIILSSTIREQGKTDYKTEFNDI